MGRITDRPPEPPPPAPEPPWLSAGWRAAVAVWLCAFVGLLGLELLLFAWGALRRLF